MTHKIRTKLLRLANVGETSPAKVFGQMATHINDKTQGFPAQICILMI